MSHDFNGEIHKGLDLDQYFCNSRSRADLWNDLKEASIGLRDFPHGSKQSEFAKSHFDETLEILKRIECYWAFPGECSLRAIARSYEERDFYELARLLTALARLVSTSHYRDHDWMLAWQKKLLEGETHYSIPSLREPSHHPAEPRPYFEVLVVDSLALETESQLRTHHLQHARPEDEFIYNIVVVSTLEDAISALTLNYNIQSCIIRYTFPCESVNHSEIAKYYIGLAGYTPESLPLISGIERSGVLARILKTIRPELDLYLLSESTVEEVARSLHRDFRRCFFGSEDYPEMRLTLLKGIYERYETPFFCALRRYTQRPSGVFHALPISRSKSISKSHWIRDYGRFYGDKIFLSETSATSAGLGSLLSPSGSILRAQELAAVAFGSEVCFFVSNGTSTANKIVLQGVSRPGDIILVSSDCHKSHHYAAILSRVRTVIVKAYQLPDYCITGATPIRSFKKKLLEYKHAGELHLIRAIVLTNLTFDGIAYDLTTLITECLAIKPDLIFIVDEAWFAYGLFTPLTRKRSAMGVAGTLKQLFTSKEYQVQYMQWRSRVGDPDRFPLEDALDFSLLPDPCLVQVRVYSTQSTHKTLTALRQASMIHIRDDRYHAEIAESLRDAYQCHTSTSPNYQILASLDIARRQMHFEGYELVQKAYELALIFRNSVLDSELLSRFFRVLGPEEMIPCHFRNQDAKEDSSESYWLRLEKAWSVDEFALDPSRITLEISRTGIDGESLKKVLMDRYDIQVNKSSHNTVLLIVHIGSTRGMITYLLEALSEIARETSAQLDRLDLESLTLLPNKVHQNAMKPLGVPSFTAFHPLFTRADSSLRDDGDIALAAALAKLPGYVRYLYLTEDIESLIKSGETIVSAALVTPYPPGYPLLLPGQILSYEIVRFLVLMGSQEIHGYEQRLGLRVFTAEALSTPLPV